MLPMERRVMRVLTGTARAGRRRVPMPRDHIVEAAERLYEELAGVRDVLSAPGTSVRLVLTPEAVVLAEARRTWTSLALYGYQVDAVVANRLVPGGGRDPWRRSWAQAQAGVMAEVSASFAPVPVQSVEYTSREPVGAQALLELGTAMYGSVGAQAVAGLLAEPGHVDRLKVERAGSQFVLVLQLPLAARRDLDLARRGDDLVVTVAGFRRVIALPSALRRCRVVGASLRDGLLRVRFEPDPSLWRPL
jgi:arsenite-transporting ATPase